MTHTMTASPRARQWLTTLVAILIAIVVLAMAPSASAAVLNATASPTPTPSATPTGTVETVLAPLGNGVVSMGGTLATSIDVRNGTSTEVPTGTATLSIGATPITDRAVLAALTGDDPLSNDVVTASLSAIAATTTIPVEPVAAGSTLTISATFDNTDGGLAALVPGVYPLLLDYQAGDLALSATSVMVITDPLAASSVGVLVPITAAPSDQALLTAQELTELTARDGALSEVLDAVEGTTAILAIDPAIVAAIRVLGNAAPATATTWLERLEALPNSRFALQFGDADISAQVHAGLSAPLQPTSLVTFADPVNFPLTTNTPTLGATVAPTPTAAPTQTSPVVPKLAVLTEITNAAPDVYWPAPGTADLQVLQAVSTFTPGSNPITIVPSETTSLGATGTAVPAAADVNGSRVLVYDSPTSAALLKASETVDTVERRTALAIASAYLALARTDVGASPLLVSIDRDAARDSLALHAAILAVTGAPGVTPAALGDLSESVQATVDVSAASPDASRTAVVQPFLATETLIAEFATILDTPALLTGTERAQILQLLGVGWNTASTAWTTAVKAHTSRSAATLTSVEILPVSEINLASSSAALRFWIRNDLPWPATVVLTARSDDLRLSVQPVVTVPVNAASNTRAEVPVQARVGRGDVTLELQLRSRTSVAIGSPQFADVRVRAEWETIGIAALATVVGGLLIAGFTRTLLRRRRARDGMPRG